MGSGVQGLGCRVLGLGFGTDQDLVPRDEVRVHRELALERHRWEGSTTNVTHTLSFGAIPGLHVIH